MTVGDTHARERLTAADASFLYMENPVMHMHVTGVTILDPSTVPDGYAFEKVIEHISSRLHLVPPFRRRLMTVPFGLDHPVWVEDPDFDLSRHLHRAALPAPGGRRELEEFVGEYAGRPLERSRPLWDMTIVEGLEGGHIACVTKMHHVAVDGVTATDFFVRLLDFTPDAPPVEPDPWEPPASVPGVPSLVADAAVNRVTDPLRPVRALGRATGSAFRIGRAVVGARGGGPTMARPFDAPRTRLNRPLTRRRNVAFGTFALEDLHVVRERFEVTVNDAFLAACAGSLRDYLIDHGDPVDRPLLVSVPVACHGEVADTRAVNQISTMFVRLPVHLADPLERLAAVHEDTTGAKAVHDVMGPDTIGDVTELAPVLVGMASRMYARFGLADRLPPVHNLVISNVAGPPIPLYVAGARIVSAFPFGPLVGGAGLNITVLSNMGNMDVGVMGCPDATPRIEALADGIVEAMAELRKLAEEH